MDWNLMLGLVAGAVASYRYFDSRIDQVEKKLSCLERDGAAREKILADLREPLGTLLRWAESQGYKIRR